MKQVKGLTSLAYGAVACNAAVIIVIALNSKLSDKKDAIGFFVSGFGMMVSILYALQLILMKRSYYRHFTISFLTKVFLHISRTITLLYALMGAYLLAATAYHTSFNKTYLQSRDFKFMAIVGLLLVTVVMNLTIFFRGWRLLKMVKIPYIEDVMASFD